MSQRHYPEYAESGIGWIGRVPSHWRLVPLGSIARVAGGATPNRDVPEFWGGDIPWVTAKDMKVELLQSAEEHITLAGLASCSTQMISIGTLIMVVRSGILKHTIPVAISAVPVALNQDLKAFRVDEKMCDARFLFRWVQGFNDALLHAWGKQGATVESIEMGNLLRSVIPIPPLCEQRAIVAFLERETAKIDALIAEQERLIALLQEKRQAVISHAVTKGLDPNVPMKESGVAWVGLVPAHWTVSSIKRVGSIQYGLGEPPPYREDGHPLVRATDVDRGTLALESAVRVHQADIPASRIVWLEPGDIIVVRSGAGTGDSGQYWGPSRSAIAGFDMVLRPTDIDAAFLQWTLLASYVLKAQIDTLRMRAAQPHLNSQELGGCLLLVPPATEQTKIAGYLAHATEQLDSVSADAAKAISLLRERRTALITAAVTGQIDVRGLVEPAA